MKTYVVVTHEKRLREALLVSTHNICLHQEVRKLLYRCPLLSGAMINPRYSDRQAYVNSVALDQTHVCI